MANVGPLAGVRVLDASRVLAGPLAGMILGDLGAEVIKIERPGAGDETRAWGPPYLGDLSAYYLSCNRNKRAVALDLAAPAGCRVFQTLVQQCDVLLENFLPATAAKLGLTPRQLHALHPRLIICSITGFGREGSWANVPGYDFAIQALSGFMGITGPAQGPPCKVGVAITDVVTGLYAVIGVLAALHARQATGDGYALDLALLDCAVASQVNVVQAFLTSGVVPPRQGNAHLQIAPYQLFATADGHLVLAIGNDGQWQRFCAATGQSQLGADPRFATNPERVRHRQELTALLEPILRDRTTGVWQDLLGRAEVPHAPVLDYRELFDLDLATERGLRVSVKDHLGRPVDLVKSPLTFHADAAKSWRAPPRLGQDTHAVLRELCELGDTEIDRLKEQGIVA